MPPMLPPYTSPPALPSLLSLSLSNMRPSRDTSHDLHRSPPPPPPPPPLHILKEPSPSPSSSSSSTSSNHYLSTSPSSNNNAATPPRHPVIIYTHSPKIIRTDARNFRALVQRLTGMTSSASASASSSSSSSAGETTVSPPKDEAVLDPDRDRSSSSVNSAPMVVEPNIIDAPAALIPTQLFTDLPMLPPHAMDLFCQRTQLTSMYRRPDAAFPGGAPSIMDAMTSFPDF